MKYLANHLRSAITIIELYKGDVPFAVFLKSYFAANKKFGSKDRRFISQLCYTYYRLGKAADPFDHQTAIYMALFLGHAEPGVWASLFNEDWLSNWHQSMELRLGFIKKTFPQFDSTQIFPFEHLLSQSIDATVFSLGHLVQPDLFIRIRPGRLPNVLKAFDQINMPFVAMNDHCYALPNGTKLEGIVELDKDYVVQDFSSQQTAVLMEPAKQLRKGKDASVDIWDCCAASGGKSILARDTIGNMELTVSDIRKSIIHNLSQRFERAGIKQYQSIVTDLSKPIDAPELAGMLFDLIICDAPCSGSGTWSRTPEQLRLFNQDQVAGFQQLQQQIVNNTLPKLRSNGYFLYITCSVFEAENEAILPFIASKFPQMTLVDYQTIKGYAVKADTMFAALFKKTN